MWKSQGRVFQNVPKGLRVNICLRRKNSTDGGSSGAREDPILGKTRVDEPFG
jgi:hypothetical protein